VDVVGSRRCFSDSSTLPSNPSGLDPAPPVAPREPDVGECCGSGCQNCVFVTYWENLTDYNLEMEAYKAAMAQRGQVGDTGALVVLLVG
jgi:hypothetical protein